MPPAPAPLALRALAPTLAGQFGVILEGLCATVAARFLYIPHLLLLTIPLWLRFDSAAKRFARLAYLFAAGRLPAPRALRPGHPGGNPPPPSPNSVCKSWLLDILRDEAAGRRAQMLHLLAQPGMEDFLSACPAAVRLLRPICRMLLIPRSALPKSAAQPRPAASSPPSEHTGPAFLLLDSRSWPSPAALRAAPIPAILKPA